MDVRCERCDTEYEFDDALVSGRGTTVKCTNCGHKFKIRRGDGDFSEDFWNIQTADGRTLVFTSLRELQRAIQTSQVERHDLLSRGGLKHKPIGQIPELRPFFDQRDQQKGSPQVMGATHADAASVRRRTSRPPPPPGVAAQALAPPVRAPTSTKPDYPPPPPTRAPASGQVGSVTKTWIGTGDDDSAMHLAAAVAVGPETPRVEPTAAMRALGGLPRASESPPSTERDPEPDTARFAREAPPPQVLARVALTRRLQPVERPRELIELPRETPPPPSFDASSPLPPPTPAAQRSMNFDDEYDGGERGRSPSRSDIPGAASRRRSVGGFIVAAVVVAGVAVIAAVWAKDHLGVILGKTPAPVATTDPRATAFLSAGEQALAEGNLEASKENFDKASALAEKDPRVLLDVARLAAVRADVPWLKSRLLGADATDDTRFTKDSLAELAAAARKAADDALAVAPDEPAAVRAKIDALRISGDHDGARALVGKVASSITQPETAYVLAGLDLASSEPLWSTVLERLRLAANAESGPGRGRAALSYALARSGDTAGAKLVVERLASMPRQHPLLPLLRAFADHARPVERAELLQDAGPEAVTIGRDGGKPERGEKGGRGLPGDARLLVQQGEAARAKGDNERAQTLFTAALERNPNDTEALNGLAAVAHARHDLNGARASYKRVLSINPSYVPALVGLGDVDFESGDRASAAKTYRDIVERFPEGTYPDRVRHRIEVPAPPPRAPRAPRQPAAGSSSGGSAPAPAPPPTTPTTPAPSDTGGGG